MATNHLDEQFTNPKLKLFIYVFIFVQESPEPVKINNEPQLKFLLEAGALLFYDDTDRKERPQQIHTSKVQGFEQYTSLRLSPSARS